MDTPLLRFLAEYAERKAVRLHMPGHKGVGSPLAAYDITEIEGADSLYEAKGVIAESEANASSLFGCHTFYSAEGSSLAIRAMLYLAVRYAVSQGRKPRVLAGRNAHKVFLSAAALLDFEITWLAPAGSTYLSCPITAEDVEAALLAGESPAAVYLTSPDYLGNTVDIAAIARVCHERGILLLVDNAHGAYLKFLSPSRHPVDLGADLCCDSAHKTLPALTGSAYLHISREAPAFLVKGAKKALALFGSTSPSYLILASLDETNRVLAEGFDERLAVTAARVSALKEALCRYGYQTVGNEPVKLSIAPKSYGYMGEDVARHLTERGIVSEFADPDHVTLMFSVNSSEEDLTRTEEALLSLPRRVAVEAAPPRVALPEKVMTPREVLMAEEECLSVEKCLGRVLASVTVGCPPAVPIAVSGERLGEAHLKAFRYY
ncbi:MAG: PLP-dependent transferase, partial [Clostridia bacterium]|nr:PLP-dependent transferase [Clostridia bacterium]